MVFRLLQAEEAECDSFGDAGSASDRLTTDSSSPCIGRKARLTWGPLRHHCKVREFNLEQPVFKRVVLKVSGESLAGQNGYGIDADTISSIAEQVKEVVELGVQVAIVCGGGNIWRGIAGSASGIDRATADYMGMLATVMNSLALQDSLEQSGVPTRVQTSIRCSRSQNLTSAAGPSAIWKRDALLSSRQVRVIRSFHGHDCGSACG